MVGNEALHNHNSLASSNDMSDSDSMFGKSRSVTDELEERRRSLAQFHVLPNDPEHSQDDILPSRWSPDQVSESVRNFAEFLRFLEHEEHQKDHPIMPVIIQRFAELGGVIEVQKRHIDGWKQKELDLAIAEAQTNLEICTEMGLTIEKQERDIAQLRVEKQKADDKYELAAEEVARMKIKAEEEIHRLTTQCVEYQKTIQSLERLTLEQSNSIEILEKENHQLKQKLDSYQENESQWNKDKHVHSYEHEELRKRLQEFETEVRKLKQQCQEESTRAVNLEKIAEEWRAKFYDQEETISGLRVELTRIGNERDQSQTDFNDLMEEGNRFQSEVQNLSEHYEAQLKDARELNDAKEKANGLLKQELQEQIAHAEQVRDELEALRQQVSSSSINQDEMEEKLLNDLKLKEDHYNNVCRQLELENANLKSQLEQLHNMNNENQTQIEKLVANERELRQHFEQQMDTAKSTVNSAEGWKNQISSLLQETQEKNKALEAARNQEAERESHFTRFIAQVERDMAVMQDENERLKSELQNGRRQEDKYKIQSTELEDRCMKLTEQCKIFQQRLSTMESALLAREEQLRHNQLELNLKVNENSSLLEELKVLQASLGSESSTAADVADLQAHRIQAEYDKYKSEMESIQKLQEQKISKLQENNTILLSQLEELKENFKHASSKLESELQRRLEEIESLHRNIERLKIDYETLLAKSNITIDNDVLDGQRKLNLENQQLRHRVTELTEDNQALNQHLDQLRNTWNSKIEEAKKEYLETMQNKESRAIAVTHQELENLRSSLQAKSTEADKLQSEINDLLRKNAAQSQELSSLRFECEKSIHEAQQQFYQEKRVLESRLAKSDQDHFQSVQQESAQRSTMRALYDERELNAQAIRTLTTQNAELQNQILSLSTDHQNAESLIQELFRRAELSPDFPQGSTLSTVIENLSNRFASQKTELNQLTLEIQKYRENIHQLEESNRRNCMDLETERELKTQEENIKRQLRQELSGLKIQLNDLEELHKRYRLEISRKNDVSELTLAKENLLKENNNLREQTSKIKDHLNEIKQERDSMSDDLNHLRQLLSDVQSQLKHEKAHADEVEQKLNNLLHEQSAHDSTAKQFNKLGQENDKLALQLKSEFSKSKKLSEELEYLKHQLQKREKELQTIHHDQDAELSKVKSQNQMIVDDLKAKLETLSQDSKALANEKDRLKVQLQNVQKKQYQTKDAKNGTDIDRLQESVQNLALQAPVGKSNSTDKDQNQTIQQLQQKLRETEQTLLHYKTNMHKRTRDLEEEVKKLNRDAELLKQNGNNQDDVRRNKKELPLKKTEFRTANAQTQAGDVNNGNFMIKKYEVVQQKLKNQEKKIQSLENARQKLSDTYNTREIQHEGEIRKLSNHILKLKAKLALSNETGASEQEAQLAHEIDSYRHKLGTLQSKYQNLKYENEKLKSEQNEHTRNSQLHTDVRNFDLHQNEELLMELNAQLTFLMDANARLKQQNEYLLSK